MRPGRMHQLAGAALAGRLPRVSTEAAAAKRDRQAVVLFPDFRTAVADYNGHGNLGLSEAAMTDVVEYLKSL